MSRKKRKPIVLLTIILVIGLIVTYTVAFAAGPGPGGTRIDGSSVASPGTYTFSLVGGGQITLVIGIGTGINEQGHEYQYNYVVSWSSTVPICEIIMKGGNDSTTYSYDGGATSGSNLKCPLNDGGNIPNISHIDVYRCDDPEPTPTLTPDPTPTLTPDPTPTLTPDPTPTLTPEPTPTLTPDPTPTLTPEPTPTPTPYPSTIPGYC